MPETDELTDSVVANLVAKMGVDERSVSETVQAVEEAERTVATITEEMRRVEDTQLGAYRNLQVEKMQAQFQRMEDTVDEYWQRRLAKVRGNTEEEKRVMDQHADDVVRIERERDRAMESLQNEQAAAAGVTGGTGAGARAGAGGLMGGARGLIGAIGWGGMAGMLGMAGMAAMMAQSVAHLRHAEAQARDVGEAAMQDPEFAAGLAPTFANLERRYPGQVTMQQVGRVAGEIAPIAPGGFVGGQQVGRRAEEAIRMGRALGVDPVILGRLMRQFNIIEGTALPLLAQRVLEVAQGAESAGIPMKEYTVLLDRMVEDGRKYNRTIPESSRLLQMFGRELYQGTLTVQQLNQAQNAAAQAPIGTQVMLGQRFLQEGGPVGEYLQEIGATDPLSAGVAIQAISQGAMPTAGGLVTPSELSLGQNAGLRTQQMALARQIRSGMVGMVEGMTGGMGGTQWQQMFVEDKMFIGMMNLNAAEYASRQDQRDAARGFKPGGGAALPGFVAGAGRPPQTVQQLLAEGEDVMRSAISNVDKFGGAVKSVADIIVIEAKLAAAMMMGDEAEVARLSGQLAYYSSAQAKKEGRWSPSQVMDPELWSIGGAAGQYLKWAVPGIGKEPRIVIENRAQDTVETNQYEDVGERFISQGMPRNLP